MKKQWGLILNLFVAASMILGLFTMQPGVVGSVKAAPPLPPDKKADLLDSILEPAEISTQDSLSKIDPALKELAQTGGKDLLDIYIVVRGNIDVGNYLTQTIVRPAVFAGVRNIYGKTTASNLLKLAEMPGVLAVISTAAVERDHPYDKELEDKAAPTIDRDAVMQELSNRTPTVQNPRDVISQGWFDVLDGHKSSEAWKKGFTGQDVVVGVLDDGIDFAHPDLMGTYAVVSDPASPYYGWPMAFSQVSVKYFAQEVLLQDLGAFGISEQWNGSRWADTSTELVPVDDGNGRLVASYQPIGATSPHNYSIPKTSLSGTVKMGSHPDGYLEALWHERVAILVVDEHTAGVYDTVYVDIDFDHNFTNDKPVTKDSPEIGIDLDSDGLFDLSAGLLVWISNGANTPPTADWLWGISCGDEVGTLKACPDNGSLVMFTGPIELSSSGSHGTLCASNVAAQGVIDGGLSTPSFVEGGVVQGAAPRVGLMDFSNHYYSGTDEDEYLVAALGYDGIANSGDEVQATSNSYGNFTQMWGGWGYIGRLVTALNMSVAPTTTWVFSAGNEGPGYGPQEGEAGPTILKAGSSTQYGSTNWDSIISKDQIMYGDPSSFYAHGPNRDGSAGVDVLANGGRGSGDANLNYAKLFNGENGDSAWETWGGTSRSGPVVAGNLALIYDAYMKRYGEWPTWDKVLAFAKSGATNSVSSPFLQGAGVIDADRATDLAAGIYGVYATPDEWQVGDWQGKNYMNFANVANTGQSYTKTYTVTNPSGYDINVGLSDGVMTKIGGYEFDFTTQPFEDESGFNFHSPDYLIPLDSATIPADAEVMIVRFIQPYSSFDPNYDYDPDPLAIENSWRMMVYNWTDVNDDNKLWVDANDNQVVNHTDNVALGKDNDGFYQVDYANSEIQQGEYIRVDYEFGGIGIPVIIHDPLNRMADGYFLGLQHRYNNGTVNTTPFKLGVEFYKRADWGWLDLNKTSLMVPAESEATFDATVAVPADAEPGIYEGVIFMEDPGDKFHAAHESALPVVVNVISDLTDNSAVVLGGGAQTNTMFQNSWTNGYFNWYGGGWTGAGDWRHFFLNVSEEDVANQNLLVHSSWNDGLPTDYNTWILGPTEDCASNGVDPCAVYSGFAGQPDSDLYGPYTLAPIGSSEPFLAGAAYPFHTSTGGSEDWVMAPLTREGLHEIALHNVLYSGEEISSQFKVDVGTLNIYPSIDPDLGTVTLSPFVAEVNDSSGTVDLNFKPTLVLPDLYATIAGGLEDISYGPFNVDVPQAANTNYSAWNAENVISPFTLTRTDIVKLTLNLLVPDAQDADLFLIYDTNNNGIADQGIDVVVGSSGNATGVAEKIVVTNPKAGQYLVAVLGYAINPTSGVTIPWNYVVTAPGNLPTTAVDVIDGPVTITQDALKFDPADAAVYQTEVTAANRTNALHVDLTGVPGTDDLDLYVTGPDGSIIAESRDPALGASESITIRPVPPAYRLDPGTYTVYVHGFQVESEDAPSNLYIWWDKLSVWLSSTRPDVTVEAIGPNQPASVTLNFDDDGLLTGKELSVRLIAGPSVLPGVFDRLMTIRLAPAPSLGAEGTWTISSDRGYSPLNYGVGDPKLHQALLAPGEDATLSLTVTNSGDLPAAFGVDTYWGDSLLDYKSFIGTEPADLDNYVFVGSIVWEGVSFTTPVLQPGETYSASYLVTMTVAAELNKGYGLYMDVYDETYNHFLAGSYVNVANYRGFSTSETSGMPAFSSKDAVATAAPGEAFDYTISLTNPSAVDTEITVVDTLPTDVDFVSVTPQEAVYDDTAGTVTWTGIVPGSSITSTDITVSVQMKSDAVKLTPVVNTATGADAGGMFMTLTATTVVDDGLRPALSLHKSVDTLITGKGNMLSYTIMLTNNGTETATNAVISDPLPQNLAYVDGSATGGATYDDVAGEIQWTGDLAVGATQTITFEAIVVNPMMPGVEVGFAIINPAMASADNSPKVVFNSALTEYLLGMSYLLPYVGNN